MFLLCILIKQLKRFEQILYCWFMGGKGAEMRLTTQSHWDCGIDVAIWKPWKAVRAITGTWSMHVQLYEWNTSLHRRLQCVTSLLFSCTIIACRIVWDVQNYWTEMSLCGSCCKLRLSQLVWGLLELSCGPCLTMEKTAWTHHQAPSEGVLSNRPEPRQLLHQTWQFFITKQVVLLHHNLLFFIYVEVRSFLSGGLTQKEVCLLLNRSVGQWCGWIMLLFYLHFHQNNLQMCLQQTTRRVLISLFSSCIIWTRIWSELELWLWRHM